MQRSGAVMRGVDALRAGCPLARKLARFVALTDADLAALEVLRASSERIAADADLVREGESPRCVFLLLEGMAARYRVLPDGGRQILTFMIPGDLSDIHCLLHKRMDHSIGIISTGRVAAIARPQLAELFAAHAQLATALQWSALQEEAMLRERVVALGRRPAHGRVAYLLCELLWRYDAIGMAAERTFCWPLTQTELGDALGLTSVYINRVLKDFRRDGLVSIMPGRLCVLEVAALQRRAGFNQDYLRLGEAAAVPARGGRWRAERSSPALPA